MATLAAVHRTTAPQAAVVDCPTAAQPVSPTPPALSTTAHHDQSVTTRIPEVASAISCTVPGTGSHGTGDADGGSADGSVDVASSLNVILVCQHPAPVAGQDGTGTEGSPTTSSAVRYAVRSLAPHAWSCDDLVPGSLLGVLQSMVDVVFEF